MKDLGGVFFKCLYFVRLAFMSAKFLTHGFGLCNGAMKKCKLPIMSFFNRKHTFIQGGKLAEFQINKI